MLVLAYVALAVVGSGYIVVSMLLGHLFDFSSADSAAHAGGGEHVATETYGVEHAGHGEASAGDGVAAAFHFPFFSPLALATLSASVGGLGLVARYGLKLADGPSLLVAFPGALVVTYAVTYAAFRVVQGSRGTSTIQPADLEGVAAEILTPIPEGGLGEAAAFVKGERFSGPAREESGCAVPRGTPVTVVRLSGSTLVVRITAR